MTDIDPRRAYIITFRRLHKHWREANLSEQVSIAVALAGAKAKFKLNADQQRDVDEFLKDEIAKASAAGGGESQQPSESIKALFDVS